MAELLATRKIKKKEKLKPLWWRKARKRAGGLCEICGKVPKVGQVHHVRGRKVDNPHAAGNLAYICRGCHRLVTLVGYCRTLVRDDRAFANLIKFIKWRIEGP